jgi:hypothetical protein
MFRSKPVVATAVCRTHTGSPNVISRLCDVESWPVWAGVTRAEAYNDAGRTSDLANAHELHLWFPDGREVTEQVTLHGHTLRLTTSVGHGVVRVEDTIEGVRLTWTSEIRARGPRFLVRRALRSRLREALERLSATNA